MFAVSDPAAADGRPSGRGGARRAPDGPDWSGPDPYGHGLSACEVAAFLSRARQLGHDTDRLLAGDEADSFVHLPTLEAVRGLVNVGVAERSARQAGFFHPAMAARSRVGQGVHDRCEAYVFADGGVGEADLERLAIHLPLVNVGELVIEPGGRVIVQGNLLVLGCRHLASHGSLEDDYHVGIWPTAGSVDRRSGPINGRPGAHGADGAPGLPGTRPSGVPTMIGFALGQPVGDRLDGNAGTGGGNGQRGEDGRTGGATKTAEITVGRLTGTLAVFATGGCGGQGGGGGDGGHGGGGGDAVSGFRTPSGSVPDGQPGRGGLGGDGADGGRGGHGGICSNVFITVPDATVARVSVRTAPGEGGEGGPGGSPGRAGREGTVGGADAARAAGSARATGAVANSNDGSAGRPGRTRPAPEVFVNGRPTTAKEPHT